MMANINSIDRIKLEKFFQMEGGYVCDFSNFTFENFVKEYTGINVYTEEYEKNGTSKANRLRYFWKKESNYANQKLLASMLEYWKTKIKNPYEPYKPFDLDSYKECLIIVNKLNTQTDDMDLLPSYSIDKDFSVLTDLIKDNLRKNRHEYVLDWLHTYVVKFTAKLCTKHSISYEKNTPLHSIFGQYVRFLKDEGLIESEMSMKILSSSIKILDEFNSVRNNKTFAHNNDIINHPEGVLIANNIIHVILFVEALEKLNDNRAQENEPIP